MYIPIPVPTSRSAAAVDASPLEQLCTTSTRIMFASPWTSVGTREGGASSCKGGPSGSGRFASVGARARGPSRAPPGAGAALVRGGEEASRRERLLSESGTWSGDGESVFF